MPPRSFPAFNRGGSVYDYMMDLQRALLPIFNLTGDNETITVTDAGNALVLRGMAASGDSSSKWVCGVLRLNSATRTVQMNEGLVRHGAVDYVIEAAEVSCGASTQIVTVRYSRHDKAEYMNPAPMGLMLPDANYIYIPLCRVNFTSGQLSIPDGGVYHRGMIWISGESP